jgi:hypothetical protein
MVAGLESRYVEELGFLFSALLDAAVCGDTLHFKC